MNERIQELAYQAEDWAIAHKAEHGSAYFHVEYTRKFAELIVRECINEIHVADVGDLKAKDYYLDKVAEHIEQHFGVQE